MSLLAILPNNQLMCQGKWTKWHLVELSAAFNLQEFHPNHQITVDGSHLMELDTLGAILLLRFLKPWINSGQILWQGFNAHHSDLIRLLLAQNISTYPSPPEPASYLTLIGTKIASGYHEILCFLAYIGAISYLSIDYIRKRRKIRWPMVAHSIQVTGYDAIPIIALLSFLVGIVLAYQLGQQLTAYGANIYVVDITGMAIFREFAPLITAIILAGRTGSAYTAQIGTMVLNQEIDAICTFGLSVQEVVVLPKIIALLISLPLLVVLADILGIAGSMFMSQLILHINYLDFIHRFGKVIELQTFLVGMAKTPFFAAIIATIGCFHGLQVQEGISNIGARTTKSVVHATFMIIVADAGFSILLSAWQI